MFHNHFRACESKTDGSLASCEKRSRAEMIFRGRASKSCRIIKPMFRHTLWSLRARVYIEQRRRRSGGRSELSSSSLWNWIGKSSSSAEWWRCRTRGVYHFYNCVSIEASPGCTEILMELGERDEEFSCQPSRDKYFNENCPWLAGIKKKKFTSLQFNLNSSMKSGYDGTYEMDN